MRQKNHIIRRVTVLVAALATLLSGGALPAAGAAPDPVTNQPPSAPPTEPAAPVNAVAPAAQGGTSASHGSTALLRPVVRPGSGSSAAQAAHSARVPHVPTARNDVRNDSAVPGDPAAPQSPGRAQSPGNPSTARDSAAPTGARSPRTSGSPESPGAGTPVPSVTPRTSLTPQAPGSARPSPPVRPSQHSPSGQPSGSDQPPQGSGALQDPAAPDAPADPRAPGAPGVPAGKPSLIRGDPRAFGAQIFKGYAFDTCQAPSGATMRAWKKASPYGAAGVYIGGRGRACPNQKHLNRSWVKAAHGIGWKFLPLYVGSQSPCVTASHKRKAVMSSSAPYQQGRREGLDAVRQAQRLGMVRRSAVYLDMEAYNYKNTRCATTTLRFIQGWNSAVRAQGYVAGFYSSSDSGIAHLERARASGARGLPTAMWFARWRVPKSVDKERRIHRSAWQPHRRIHQFTGNVTRKYGGHTVNIDQNLVDAPVAVIG